MCKRSTRDIRLQNLGRRPFTTLYARNDFPNCVEKVVTKPAGIGSESEVDINAPVAFVKADCAVVLCGMSASASARWARFAVTTALLVFENGHIFAELWVGAVEGGLWFYL